MKEINYKKMLELTYEPDKRLMFKHANLIIKDLELDGFETPDIICYFQRLFKEELQ